MSSPDCEAWKAAMDVEMESLANRSVYTLVPRPKGAKVITCRWHLKRKMNLDGSLNKLNARLVARGFDQREGINYKDTFAPSSRQESLKMFLTYNAIKDWNIIQLDVVGAFLYGLLDETVYLEQPPGYVDSNFPDHVWELNRSLYGLKQSARQWHTRLVAQLKAMGFTCSVADPSL